MTLWQLIEKMATGLGLVSLFFMALGIIGLVYTDLSERRRKARTIARINRAFVEDWPTWPCYGGPRDGERHAAAPLAVAGGRYEFCIGCHRYEWREQVRA